MLKDDLFDNLIDDFIEEIAEDIAEEERAEVVWTDTKGRRRSVGRVDDGEAVGEG